VVGAGGGGTRHIEVATKAPAPRGGHRRGALCCSPVMHRGRCQGTHAAWRSPARLPIESAEPSPKAAAARASSAATGCAPVTTTRTHIASERRAVQEDDLVGAERGGWGQQGGGLELEAVGALHGAVARGGWGSQHLMGLTTAPPSTSSSGSRIETRAASLTSSAVCLRRHGVS
jgi:hypothetical protein